jgi:hypothetical protein
MARPALDQASGAAPRIQRFAWHTGSQGTDVPASVDHVLAGPGMPLEPTLRQDMEQRFGRDFSAVRIHIDAAAQRSASELNANAYTSGPDIVFDAGRFAPATWQGRRLIAHELTHVVQQRGTADGGSARPAIQREKRHNPERTGKADNFSIELDRGLRGRYLVHLGKPHSRDEVLVLLFTDGALPQGYELEDKGIDLLGWCWKLTTAEGPIDTGTFQKLTPAFQKHFRADTLSLTGEESGAIHARSEEFMDSRPVYLGGQSVREAFEQCGDHRVGEGVSSSCWGRRAGYFYYIGWQGGYTQRVLEVKSSPQSPHIIKDWEYWLDQRYSLQDAAAAEEELQTEILKQMIFAYASALAAAPGAARRPTVPPSPAKQVGQIAVKGVQTVEAWKTALGKDPTDLDLWLAGLAGMLEAGTELLPAAHRQFPKARTAKRPPADPTHVPPAAPAVLGSQDKAHWSDAPRVTPNPADRLTPGDRDVTDLNRFSKEKAVVDKVRRAQQTAKAANDNQLIDAQARVAVGQTVGPSSQSGGGPYASAKGAKPTTPATVGNVSSSQTTGRSDPKPTRTAPRAQPRPAVKNLVPEPYPLPPRGLGSYTNDDLLNFYRDNRARYPKAIQQLIKNVPTTGRVKTAQREQLEAIDKAIRDLHTQDANRRVVGGSAEEPFVQSKRATGNEGERFNAALTGNKRLNLTGETRSGERVEFDSVRLAEHRLLETKINLSPYTTSGDVIDQMRRQATFARDWGFSQVRWEVYDYDSFQTARYAHEELSQLNPELGSRIDVVNPSDAFR